jgi:hypothetical protein
MKKIFHVFTILLCCLLILISKRGQGEQINENISPISSPEESFFTLQVGAFINKQNASTLQKKLIQKGYTVYIIESLNKSGESLKQERKQRNMEPSFIKGKNCLSWLLPQNPK